MTVTVIRADARHLPLEDDSVDLVVTSPPYFALRSYQDGGEHYAGQVGAEATPAEFVDALLEVTRECVRVLKPSGSMWVNLGDKYSGAQAQNTAARNGDDAAKTWRQTDPKRTGIPNKSLMGIPWRYALRCIDDLGLILRAEVIWCLSGGAKVYARIDGRDRPIMLRDLVRAYRPEQVKLWNGERWTQVRGWNRTPDDDGALEVELRTGERIGCTPGHKWPTDRGVIRADEIRLGDVIRTTRLPEPDEPRTPAYLPDEDIGWLVGLYVAEGSRSERMVQIAGHVNETARHARLERIARALDGQAGVYQTSDNGATCNLSGSVLLGVIDRYVSPGTAKTKRLRMAAWQRSDGFLTSVLEGYLSGDGHYDAKNDRWRLGFTANDEWASDLRTIAARLGVVLKLRRADHVMAGRTFPGWRGEIRYTRSTHRNAKHDGEVVAIRRSRARDFYDLGVEDDPHLFALASGVLTHNSKPNGLPESVTDRVRRSHEQWFHFTLQPRYFSAVDEIREAHQHVDRQQVTPRKNGRGLPPRGPSDAAETVIGANPLGKLPGSVWTDTGDDGESVVRSVLHGVSVGAITIDEGERILWTAARGSFGTSSSRTAAGNGAAGATPVATGSPARSRGEARTGHTGSPTSCSSDPSLTGSPSTTSAETSVASDPTTSSRSPEPRTSGEPSPNGLTAHPATASPTPTPKSPVMGGSESGAGPVTSAGSAADDSVWVVPTEPLRVPAHLGVDHFAAFPSEFPRRIVQGWSPSGVCVGCGEGRRPVAEADYDTQGRTTNGPKNEVRKTLTDGPDSVAMIRSGVRAVRQTTITGYVCACPDTTAPTTPAVVLDPFGGTGTTAHVASALGRHGISVDLSADYCRLAESPELQDTRRRKVLGIDKARPEVTGQSSMFDLDGAA